MMIRIAKNIISRIIVLIINLGTACSNHISGRMDYLLRLSDTIIIINIIIIYIFSFVIFTLPRFQVSASNGVIFVSDILDREFRDAYYMTLEARDGGGFRTTVPLTIYIDDVNDNAPHFRRQEHAEIIREGQPFFSRSLVVEVSHSSLIIGTY